MTDIESNTWYQEKLLLQTDVLRKAFEWNRVYIKVGDMTPDECANIYVPACEALSDAIDALEDHCD